LKLLRGYLALTVVLLALLLSDPVQRLVIAPLAKLVPSRRIALLNWWQKLMAKFCMIPVSVIGGVRLPAVPEIPGEPGVLIVMNHQSVLDIPLMVKATQGASPKLVTRKRYLRWIPLISHMVRLYQYPVVDPTANSQEMRASLRSIRDAARASDVPMAIFPEGTRTKDGEIGPFRPRGLQLILKQRPWTVYVMVVDGFWKNAKMKHFIRGMTGVRGELRLVGTYEWTDPKQDATHFIEELRQIMVENLAEMRSVART
jgi:1-acyl-sn-glycerol-3-phosphate acyltransferase